MGLLAVEFVYARDRHEPYRRYDRREANAWGKPCAGRYAARLVCLIAGLLLSALVSVQAETIRIATFNTELSRKGPGLLVRDFMRGEAEDIRDSVERIVRAQPDVLVLQGIDYDAQSAALGLLQSALKASDLDLPYRFARIPNSGRITGFDLNRNGYLGDAADKQSFGLFTGQNGMAVLSRFRIQSDAAQDFSDFLWRDLPNAQLPVAAGEEYFRQEEAAILRLHAIGAWEIPIETPFGVVRLLTSHASPPVFDGPEDRNGLRNADEVRFWEMYLGGWRPEDTVMRAGPFVLIGDFNNDRNGGEGRKPAINALLAHASIHDPLADRGPTVLWDFEGGPGALRVDYILPSRELQVANAGQTVMGGQGKPGSRHALVWLDLGPLP